MVRDWDRFVREVMERVDLFEFLSQYTTLKRGRSNCMGLCPLHGDKDPSFSVSPDVGLWHCFGCQKGGNIFTFIMEKEGMSFFEAAELISNRYNIPLPKGDEKEDISPKKSIYEMNRMAEQFYADFIRGEKGGAFKQYLRSRKITKDIVERFNIGAAPDEWDCLVKILRKKGFMDDLIVKSGLGIKHEKGSVYDRFRGRLMIPIRDHLNRTVGFGGRIVGEGEPKYLNSPESPVFTKGDVLFALPLAKDAIRKDGYAIIMEGYTDVMRAHQCGFTCAVASMGTALTETQITKLNRLAKKVFLAFDGDSAGIASAVRSCEELMNPKFDIVTRVVIFEEGMDPEDFLRVKGKEEFQKKLDKSREGIIFLIDNSLPEEIPTHEDEKIQILKNSAKYINRINYQSLRDRLIRRIADRVGVSESYAGDVISKTHSVLKTGNVEEEKKGEIRKPHPEEFELMKYIVNFPPTRSAAQSHITPAEIEYYPYKKFLELLFDKDFPIEHENLQELPQVYLNEEFLMLVSELVNSLGDGEYTMEKFTQLLSRKKCKSIDLMRKRNQRELEKAHQEGDDAKVHELSKKNAELMHLSQWYRKDFCKED